MGNQAEILEGITYGAARSPARLTIVEQACHECGESASPHGHQFSRELSSDDESDEWTMKVGEQWQAVGAGRVGKPGMLLLANKEGRFTQTIPTPEEKAEAAERIIEVGLLASGASGQPHPFAQLRAGESNRFEPLDILELHLRCQSGAARCLVTIIPA